MGIEGELQIRHTPEGVTIDSTRPLYACRIFQGKSVQDTVNGLPLLYSLCSTAQACAAVRASEQALQIEIDPQVQGVRDALVRMESLREHLWRGLLDWPQLLEDEAPKQQQMSTVLQLQQQYIQELTENGSPFQIGQPAKTAPDTLPLDLLKKIQATVMETVFGVSPQQWLAIESIDQLIGWAEEQNTVASALIHHVITRRWQAVGRTEIDPLPFLEYSWLQKQMGQEPFIAQPEYKGRCYETSSLTRNDSILLRALAEQYGNGLLTRLAARLAEIATLSLSLQPQATTVAMYGTAGKGISQVEAARGKLIHSVVTEGEQIAQYRILAPTEWNFHPQGVVAAALNSLQGDRETIAAQAKLLTTTIDPCVGYRLEVSDA